METILKDIGSTISARAKAVITIAAKIRSLWVNGLTICQSQAFTQRLTTLTTQSSISPTLVTSDTYILIGLWSLRIRTHYQISQSSNLITLLTFSRRLSKTPSKEECSTELVISQSKSFSAKKNYGSCLKSSRLLKRLAKKIPSI